MDSCVHAECNKVRKITGMLFDGQPLTMVDASEDTPGAMPYGSECSVRHARGFFQIQDAETGEWFLVTVYRITDDYTCSRLTEFAGRIGAQPDSTAAANPEEGNGEEVGSAEV